MIKMRGILLDEITIMYALLIGLFLSYLRSAKKNYSSPL